MILKLEAVEKTYRSAGPAGFTALKDVNLEVRSGEFLGITGKSGAGKTTLLNVISGVSRPSAGNISFYPAGAEGASPPIPIHRLNEDQLALWRGRNVGVVYQSFELMPTLSLVENVMLPSDFSADFQPLVTYRRALDLLEEVGIAEHAHKIPAHISGGQKQRVAIARALVNDPLLILADEPTGSLDSLTAGTILQIFEELVGRGKTVLMVTHDESFTPRFSRHLQIKDGEVDLPGASDTRASRIRLEENRDSSPVQVYPTANQRNRNPNRPACARQPTGGSGDRITKRGQDLRKRLGEICSLKKNQPAA